MRRPQAASAHCEWDAQSVAHFSIKDTYTEQGLAMIMIQTDAHRSPFWLLPTFSDHGKAG